MEKDKAVQIKCPLCSGNNLKININSDEPWNYYSGDDGILSLKYCYDCGSVLSIFDRGTKTLRNYHVNESELLNRIEYFKLTEIIDLAEDNKNDRALELCDKELFRLKGNLVYIYVARGRIHEKKGEFEKAAENFEMALKLIALLNITEYHGDMEEYESFGPYSGCIGPKEIYEKLSTIFRKTGKTDKADFYAKKAEQEKIEEHYDDDDYDENGNKIEVPEWWKTEGDGTACGYKDWEDSNDRS